MSHRKELVKQGREWPVLLVCIKAKTLREKKWEKKHSDCSDFLSHTGSCSLYITHNEYTNQHTPFDESINSINMIADMTEKWCLIDSDIYMYIPVLDEVKDTDGFKAS